MTHPVTRRAALPSFAFASTFALAISISNAYAAADPATTASPTDSVFVTATRTPQKAGDIISDTLSISAEQIAESGAGSLIDLLQRQRGIEVARNGGAGTSAAVYIRGANANQNIVLVDGVRIGSSTLGTANWSAIPLTAIDHVEIVYGPLSTLYGADAIGGVIQIFTKRGKGAPEFTAFAGFGTNNTREADASVSGSTGGDHSISYALSIGDEKSDGFSATKPGNFSYNPDADGYDKKNAAGQASIQLAPGQEAGLLFLNSRLDAQYDSGASSYDTRALQRLENVAVYSKNQILPMWTSQIQYAESRDKSGTDTSALASGKSEIDTKQTDITWQNDILIGADTLQLLYDHRKEEVESSSTPQLQRDRTTKSFAAAYNLKRGDNLVNIGVRNDDSSQYGSKTTGSAGYGYHVTPALRASASIGTSFRAPTYNELYYPGFGIATNKPEQGRNAEAGLHYDSKGTQLGAVYYHNRLTDLLVTATPCPFDPKTYSFGCAYNVNHALLEGVTLSGGQQLGDFHFGGSIDLQDPKDETTGNRLARRSKKHADFTADYSLGALKAGAELDLSGDRFDDAANKNRLGGYGLVNLYTTYRFAPDWSVLVRWNNIGDKHYELARYYGTATATVFAGLRYGYK
ncbi:TonB-dependent siderophore receptor [Rugamonas sp.]|uniref:TonB-dependent receptor plug domain-containing protein n=1 Tax=Rugamonas sp. TaxID=1926287 RepID=UPI0025F68608|nr:TonB-dependent receptor [Rugamonas sp.]